MDLRFDYDPEQQGADLFAVDGILQYDGGLRTAIIISLFTDARADDADALPTSDSDRRGWWADSFAEIEGDITGSRMWLLSRAKQTDETLELARGYARTALRWLIEDGIASAVNVVTSWHAIGVMRLDVDLTRATDGAVAERYTFFWDVSYAV